jgi:hypothetical protein
VLSRLLASSTPTSNRLKIVKKFRNNYVPIAVEHSVTISNFLMNLVNISFQFNNHYINLHNLYLKVLSKHLGTIWCH